MLSDFETIQDLLSSIANPEEDSLFLTPDSSSSSLYAPSSTFLESPPTLPSTKLNFNSPSSPPSSSSSSNNTSSKDSSRNNLIKMKMKNNKNNKNSKKLSPPLPLPLSSTNNNKNNHNNNIKNNSKNKNNRNKTIIRKNNQIENKESNEKSKYIRDPNLPKRPLTPYLRFSVKERSRLLALYPASSYRSTANTVATLWKNMTAAEKKPFVQEYEEDMKLYNLKKEAYLGTGIQKDFEMFRGSIKGKVSCARCRSNYNGNTWKGKKEWEGKGYEVDWDFDGDFWEGYREARMVLDSGCLGRLVAVMEERGDDEEGRKCRELGDGLNGLVKYLKKNFMRSDMLGKEEIENGLKEREDEDEIEL